jgi:5-methylcytosine-specific restriction endonuclease McrA
MTRISPGEFAAIKRLAAERKAKRLEKGIALGLRKKKARRKPNSRRLAFTRLKLLCKTFTLSRTKKRTGGACEVGVLCGGLDSATLAYHVFPAATGNAIKYDPRNLLGACARCNGGEYFDRKRGTYERWDRRHKSILGEALWNELRESAGRKQIATHEAVLMGDDIKLAIESGNFFWAPLSHEQHPGITPAQLGVAAQDATK